MPFLAVATTRPGRIPPAHRGRAIEQCRPRAGRHFRQPTRLSVRHRARHRAAIGDEADRHVGAARRGGQLDARRARHRRHAGLDQPRVWRRQSKRARAHRLGPARDRPASPRHAGGAHEGGGACPSGLGRKPRTLDDDRFGFGINALRRCGSAIDHQHDRGRHCGRSHGHLRASFAGQPCSARGIGQALWPPPLTPPPPRPPNRAP